MKNLGFVCLDLNRSFDDVKRVTHICIEGPREIVSNALESLVGGFPLVAHLNGRNFYVPVNKESEDYNVDMINKDGMSTYGNTAGSAYSIIELADQFLDREELEEDDLVYDAKEGCYDVDVSDLSDWTMVDLDIPKDYYSDLNYKNLYHVLENITAQNHLFKVEQ